MEIIKVVYCVESSGAPGSTGRYRTPFEYEFDGKQHRMYAYWSDSNTGLDEETIDARAKLAVEDMLRQIFGESAVYNFTRVEALPDE